MLSSCPIGRHFSSARIVAIMIALGVGQEAIPGAAWAQRGEPTGQCTGPRNDDPGPCRSLPGPSTRTIIIEREIVHRLGPPVIIWKLPSAEGATQSEFAPIMDPATRQAFENESVTAYMLFRKGRAALRAGNCADALAHLQAARSRGPSASELEEIESELAAARTNFNCELRSAHVKFEKNPDRKLLHIEGLSDEAFKQLFDPARDDLEPVRRELLPLFMAQQAAKTKRDNLKASRDAPAAELQKAERELKTAEVAVEKKVKEKEPVIWKLRPSQPTEGQK